MTIAQFYLKYENSWINTCMGTAVYAAKRGDHDRMEKSLDMFWGAAMMLDELLYDSCDGSPFKDYKEMCEFSVRLRYLVHRIYDTRYDYH